MQQNIEHFKRNLEVNLDDVDDYLDAINFLKSKETYLQNWLDSFEQDEEIWLEGPLQDKMEMFAVIDMKVDQAKKVEEYAQRCLVNLDDELKVRSSEGDSQLLNIKSMQISLASELKEIEGLYKKIKEKSTFLLDEKNDPRTGTGLEAEVEIYKKSLGDDVDDYLYAVTHLEKKEKYLQDWLDSFRNKKMWDVGNGGKIKDAIGVIEMKVNRAKEVEEYVQKCLESLKGPLKERKDDIESDKTRPDCYFELLKFDPSGYLDDEDQTKWSEFQDKYKRYNKYYEGSEAGDEARDKDYEQAVDFRKDMKEFQKSIREKYKHDLNIENMQKNLKTKIKILENKFSEIKKEVSSIIDLKGFKRSVLTA